MVSVVAQHAQTLHTLLTHINAPVAKRPTLPIDTQPWCSKWRKTSWGHSVLVSGVASSASSSAPPALPPGAG